MIIIKPCKAWHMNSQEKIWGKKGKEENIQNCIQRPNLSKKNKQLHLFLCAAADIYMSKELF